MLYGFLVHNFANKSFPHTQFHRMTTRIILRKTISEKSNNECQKISNNYVYFVFSSWESGITCLKIFDFAKHLRRCVNLNSCKMQPVTLLKITLLPRCSLCFKIRLMAPNQKCFTFLSALECFSHIFRKREFPQICSFDQKFKYQY